MVGGSERMRIAETLSGADQAAREHSHLASSRQGWVSGVDGKNR